MLPLTLAATGEEHIVRRIGGLPEVRAHLADLGVNAGTTVTVVCERDGDVIVKVMDASIAISRETAQEIMV